MTVGQKQQLYARAFAVVRSSTAGGPRPALHRAPPFGNVLFWEHQQQMFLRCRYFSTNQRGNNNNGNPYLILGVPVNSSYDAVKAAFLKKALQHHPDRSPEQKSKKDSTTQFVCIRHAFEEILQDHKKGGGTVVSNNDAWQPPVWNSDAEFEVWFRRNTNDHLTFKVCDKTRAEIIHVYNTMAQGGKDKGGYWEMARQMAERETVIGVHRSGGPAVGQLESSTTTSTSIRRRRRKR